MNKDDIQIVTYDPTWPEKAEKEIKSLFDWLDDDVLAIEHVGSTAIVGMQAKPIIDIQVAVANLLQVKDKYITILEQHDYCFWQDNPDNTRLFFSKRAFPDNNRTHHLHIVAMDSSHWRDKLFFRDYLHQHADVAEAYQELKLALAKKFQHDREAYTEGKSEFIQRICDLQSKKAL